jgi:hypothetical protein
VIGAKADAGGLGHGSAPVEEPDGTVLYYRGAISGGRKMIVVKVSMIIHRGKRDEAITLLHERDALLEKEGIPKAARMYVRKLASPMSPEIVREYEFKDLAEYEKAWAKRMKPTPESKKWSAQFDPLVAPGTMGYEVYELLEG